MLRLQDGTGSGKTVVMAMLVAWAFCNRGTKPATRAFHDGRWWFART
jgi:hypothetical protein